MRQYGEGLEKVENEKSCRERAVKCRCRTHIYRYVTLWHRREMNSVKSQAHKQANIHRLSCLFCMVADTMGMGGLPVFVKYQTHTAPRKPKIEKWKKEHLKR